MAGIMYEDVRLPNGLEGLAFVLHNVFTHKECSEYIEKTEEMGYTKAMLNVGYGREVLQTDVRNSSRCIWDSFEEAGRIWNRIKEFIPEVWNNRRVICLNERLRFLRYDPGEFFLPHMDGSYMRENGERSYITVQLYLNEGFQGGSTTFLGRSDKDRVEVVPKTEPGKTLERTTSPQEPPTHKNHQPTRGYSHTHIGQTQDSKPCRQW